MSPDAQNPISPASLMGFNLFAACYVMHELS